MNFQKLSLILLFLFLTIELSAEHRYDYDDDYGSGHRPQYGRGGRPGYGRPQYGRGRYGRERVRYYKPIVPFDEILGLAPLKDKSRDEDYGSVDFG